MAIKEYTPYKFISNAFADQSLPQKHDEVKAMHWILLSLIVLSLCFFHLFQGPAKGTCEEAKSYAEEREKMVNEQLIRRGIRDEIVLKAMRTVPRHLFVPPHLQKYAYDDGPLSIGHGQTISQPYIVALMTELIRPKPGDKVLEVGTGSGYQVAVLAQIVGDVYTVEIVPELAQEARERLARLSYANVHVLTGDGFYGWEEHAPYDAIIVTAALPYVPPPLFNQLKEGGRLCMPQGAEYEIQHLILYEKEPGGKTKKQNIIDVRFVPLVGGH